MRCVWDRKWVRSSDPQFCRCTGNYLQFSGWPHSPSRGFVPTSLLPSSTICWISPCKGIGQRGMMQVGCVWDTRRGIWTSREAEHLPGILSSQTDQDGQHKWKELKGWIHRLEPSRQPLMTDAKILITDLTTRGPKAKRHNRWLNIAVSSGPRDPSTNQQSFG
jgi:hypothetical protein